MNISDEQIRGKAIIGSDGRVVGHVVSINIDGADLRVETLQVRLRKEIAHELGAHGTLLHGSRIELPASMIQSVGDTIVLSTTVGDLQPLVGQGADQEERPSADQPSARASA